MQQQDIHILEQLKKGNISAFDILFQKYYKLLCVNAYFFLKNEQEAKDIVQSFFADVWEKKLYLQFHGDDVKAYLFRSIKNRCINQLGKQKTRIKNYTAFAKMQEETCGAFEDAQPDYYTQMRNTVEGLSTQKKLAVQMVYVEGKRYQDAADEMGISINSFKTHLKSGLRTLRHEIKIKND